MNIFFKTRARKLGPKVVHRIIPSTKKHMLLSVLTSVFCLKKK